MRPLAGGTLFLWLCLPCAAWPQSPLGVLTGQYENSRAGANLYERTLTPANVSANTFGLLFIQTVDADIFAQPLYVPSLTINGSPHNVVFVATLNNSVYAFDADTPQPALWQATFGPPVINVGILSTPVIDTSLNAIFLVTYINQSGTIFYTLHALNLLTGKGKAHIVVEGAVQGTGDNSQSTPCTASSGGTVQPPCIPFVAKEQLQRPALLEDAAHAEIYLAFGTRNGSEATVPYHGWLIGYHFNGSAFTQTFIFNSTLNSAQSGPPCSTATPPRNQCGHGGGIWMSGRGPALDSTGIYVVTGNGGYGGTGSGNWGESALRLNGLGVADAFTPYNYATLNQNDLDLGDAGALLFTSTNATAQNLMVAAGKTGWAYVLNRASLGGYNLGNTGAIQSFLAASSSCGEGPGQNNCYEIHSMALWQRPNANPLLYVWAWGDSLRVWDFDPATNQFRPDANQGTLTCPNYPGGGLAISANGADNGIVWAIVPVLSEGAGANQPGALYAFDATNVSTPLWSSTDYWFAAKFTIPTVAAGKVYVPTAASPPSVTPAYTPQLVVYGPCSNCTQTARR